MHAGRLHQALLSAPAGPWSAPASSTERGLPLALLALRRVFGLDNFRHKQKEVGIHGAVLGMACFLHARPLQDMQQQVEGLLMFMASHHDANRWWQFSVSGGCACQLSAPTAAGAL